MTTNKQGHAGKKSSKEAERGEIVLHIIYIYIYHISHG